eukprot:TRINITY_DN4351_c0_g1_i1.p1 TRINITY_DN4351_c0_g1~~TRINITY_DN4351_c0_g1_i1.p1  ORF type:complete len:232 (+),score=36.44 TRINITY_DN4351_c0_g1_i1:36-731(+)
MATCRGCCKMGHPLNSGYCKGCRGVGPATFCRNDRERGWNSSNKITYSDPSPLLGDMQFPLKEKLSRDFPIRRNPVTVCDCAKCKAEGPRRGHNSYSALHTPSPRKTPAKNNSARKTQHSPQKSMHSPASPIHFEPKRYSAFYDSDPEPDSLGLEPQWPHYAEAARTASSEEEIAYNKLLSAFETIRGAVVEQQHHEQSIGGHSHLSSPAAAHLLSMESYPSPYKDPSYYA